MDQDRTAGDEIIRLGIWNRRVQNALAKEVDLPVHQLECVLLLYLDHPESAGSLAKKMGIQRSSLSKLLSALQERGLIERAFGESDRRTERLTLTETGLAMVGQIRSGADEIARSLLDLLPEERRPQFMRCVRTITSNEIVVEAKATHNQPDPTHELTII